MFTAEDAKQEVIAAMQNETSWMASQCQLYLLDALKEVFKAARFEHREVGYSVVYVNKEIVEYMVDNLKELGYSVEDQRVTHNRTILTISW